MRQTNYQWTDIKDAVIAGSASFTQDVTIESVHKGGLWDYRGHSRVVYQLSKPARRGWILGENQDSVDPIDSHPLGVRSGQVKITLGQVVETRRLSKIWRIADYIRASAWDQPCQSMFTELVRRDPQLLIDIIRYWNLSNTQLSYAVETLGYHHSIEEVINTLLPLLRHQEALIREGVVYGFGHHISDLRIRELLSHHLRVEISPGVRSAIEEVLESEFEE